MIGALRSLGNWSELSGFVDKLSDMVVAFRQVDADRRELVEKLKPFRDAYHALPEEVRETDMRRRAELETGMRPSPAHAPRVVVMVGDVSLTVEDLFRAALVYEKHVEKTP